MKPDAFGETQAGRIVLRNEHLEPAEVERRDAPRGEQAKSLGCNTPTTDPWNDPASELTGLMFAHHDHDLPEVDVSLEIGNGEMEQFAAQTVLLEQLHHPARVS